MQERAEKALAEGKVKHSLQYESSARAGATIQHSTSRDCDTEWAGLPTQEVDNDKAIGESFFRHSTSGNCNTE